MEVALMKWKCKEDCAECCGIVPIPNEIFDRNSADVQKDILKSVEFDNDDRIYETADGYCPFLTADKKCAIYNDRPDICKRYGIDPTLPCPHIKPNGNPRSTADSKRTQRKINQEVDNKLKKMRGIRTGIKWPIT
jgi:hypothetical protein